MASPFQILQKASWTDERGPENPSLLVATYTCCKVTNEVAVWGAEGRARRKACASYYFGEEEDISCLSCANTLVGTERVTCGTAHCNAGNCLVLLDMNGNNLEQVSRLFPYDPNGRFLLTALRLGDQMTTRPSVARIKAYLADKEPKSTRRKAIWACMTDAERHMVSTLLRQVPAAGGGAGSSQGSGGAAAGDVPGDEAGDVLNVEGGTEAGAGLPDEAQKRRKRGRSRKNQPRDAEGKFAPMRGSGPPARPSAPTTAGLPRAGPPAASLATPPGGSPRAGGRGNLWKQAKPSQAK